MMIIIKTPSEVAKIREAGRVVARALRMMTEAIVPNESTTLDLDRVAREVMRKAGASSAFFGYQPPHQPPYPGWTCISVNEEVVHGIPGDRMLKEGDIVGLDVGVVLNGFYADAATTVPVGKVKPDAQRLLEVSEKALEMGIEQARAGNHVEDIGYAIQRYTKKHGYSIVKEMVGHGVGKKLHEEPQVANFGTPGHGALLRAGMTIAIEPMVNIGRGEIKALDDHWTIVTADRTLSAHFEHTVLVTEGEPMILTQEE